MKPASFLTCCLMALACASNPPPPVAAPAPAVPADPVSSANASPAAPPPVAPVAATPAPPAPAVRPAAAILADAIKALGGESAINAHTTVREKTEVSFQGMGITGTAERFGTRTDKALVITEVPGMGTTREGANGKVFWSQDPVNGLRVLTGAEAEQSRIDSSWCPELRLTDLYKTIETKVEAGPGGAPLECLVLTPSEGNAVTNCYDATTHLQVIQKGSRASPQGDIPFLTVVKDWRDVGGVKMPFGLDTQAGPLTYTVRVIDVKFDQHMDDKMFEPPTAAAKPDKAAGAKPEKAKTKVKTRTPVQVPKKTP
jgi:hypothetical protein